MENEKSIDEEITADVNNSASVNLECDIDVNNDGDGNKSQNRLVEEVLNDNSHGICDIIDSCKIDGEPNCDNIDDDGDANQTRSFNGVEEKLETQEKKNSSKFLCFVSLFYFSHCLSCLLIKETILIIKYIQF